MPLQCRFYEDKFPSVNDIVVVNVDKIKAMGSDVELLEYNKIRGMILHTELSRRRIRSINKLIRVGRNETVLVVRVDAEKGYIDLSKRRVLPNEINLCQERFAKAKAVNQILRRVAEKMQFDKEEQLEALYDKTAWHFDRKAKIKGIGAYEAFKKAVATPTIFDECELEPELLECLLQDIKHRLMPQAVKMRADFEVSCFTYEGIDAIKAALKAGFELSSDEFPIKINLIAPPLYVMTTQSMDWTTGLELMEKSLGFVQESIEKQGGSFVMKQKPRVVTETDDADLAKQFVELEEANREVSGDDSCDEEDEDEGSEEEGDDGDKKRS